MTVQSRHTKSLLDSVGEFQAASKGRKGIDKRVTTFGAAAKDAGGGDTGGGAIAASPSPPTEEQLARINAFTRTPKTADQLVVFETLSCNDLFDRDDEAFTTDTVKGFAKLPDPFGPVGKAYMVSHDYSKLPVGRIFGAGTRKVAVDDNGTQSTFLTNEVYVPNTDTNKALIEGIDFGINWAVSVGVMLEASKCSLSWCGKDMMGFGRWAWCVGGHDKGYFYTPDAETDSWGYAIPVEEGTKGAEKCRTLMEGAKDFYELSQCFLGAQFFAALDSEKSATAKGILKAATTHSIPIIGLSHKEASTILDGVVDARVIDAVRRFGAKPDDGGMMKWTDDQSLVWEFEPDTGVMCLGKSNDDSDGEEDEDGTAQEQPAADAQRSGDPEHESDEPGPSADAREGADSADGGSGADKEPEGDGQDGSLKSGHSHSHTHDNGTVHSHNHTHNGENGYQHTSSDNVTHAHSHDNSDGKEATVSKAAVVKALRSLGNVSDAVLQAVEDATGDDLDTALRPLVGKITEQSQTIKGLETKAALGDDYIKAKRADALDWYVKANQAGADKGVNTDSFERLLSMAGDNVELIDELITQQKALAQAKFPTAVRRSSFPTDANAPGEVPALPTSGDDVTGRTANTVRRLHG